MQKKAHHDLPLLCRGPRSTSGGIRTAPGLICSVFGFTGLAVYHLRNATADSSTSSYSSLRATPSLSADFFRDLQDIDGENCTLECCKAASFEEEICGPDDNEWISDIPFAVQILLIIFLISLSALFSGLTLGLMSLDQSGLEIVMSGDDPKAAQYAKNIYPVRKEGNLLLCTLLLGNVLVNTLLSILMAEYTGGVIGLFASTFLIVIFGEITPQAVVSCSLVSY